MILARSLTWVSTTHGSTTIFLLPVWVRQVPYPVIQSPMVAEQIRLDVVGTAAFLGDRQMPKTEPIRIDVIGTTILLAALKTIPPQVLRLASCVAESPHKCYTNEELCDALWADDPDGGPLSAATMIRLYVCQLRAVGFTVHRRQPSDNIDSRRRSFSRSAFPFVPTPEIEGEILAFYAAGHSQEETARQFKLARYKVHKILAARGILSKSRIAAILFYYFYGHSLSQTAARFGMTRRGVRRFLREQGVKAHKHGVRLTSPSSSQVAALHAAVRQRRADGLPIGRPKRAA